MSFFFLILLFPITVTGWGAVVDSGGRFRLLDMAAGFDVVRVSKLGYAMDSSNITIRGGSFTTHSVTMPPSPAVLSSVLVTTQRLGSSQRHCANSGERR